jgi:long-chain acyl-CoA synthetase
MELELNTLWLAVSVLIFFLATTAYYVAHKKKLTHEIIVGHDDHGGIRRTKKVPINAELLTSPKPQIKTIYDVLLYGAEHFPKTKKLFGRRKIQDTIHEPKKITKTINGRQVEETKSWKYFKLSPYEWMTYDDVVEHSTLMGSGFITLGLKSQDKIAIFHSTSQDWMLMAFAAYSQNITITTCYDNLGVDALSYSLNEGKVSTLFTQADLLETARYIGSSVPLLKNIIYSGDLSMEKLNELKSFLPQIKFMSIQELLMAGKQTPVPVRPPHSSDLCCIMYTSGSTGNPKGVMLTHANMLASVAGIMDTLGDYLTPNTFYLGYLPLAHVLEFVIEIVCVYRGIAIGYGSPKSLTDASVRNCQGDIKELKPHYMAGVPLVWETIRKGVLSKLEMATPFQQKMFHWAFRLKRRLVNLGFPSGFINKTVFKAISENTGGRLKCIISGGAPIAEETQEFLSMTVAPVIQGYGLTEVSGIMAVQSPKQVGSFRNVGIASGCCDIKLVASGDYHPLSDRPKGEIWVRGPSVMKGYYEQQEETRNSLTEDGWFMTRDIGQWNQDGTLSIIDRKKNLVKLSQGEYVALEKLESIYRTSKYVANMCVVADPQESVIVALIVPEKSAIKVIQDKYGIPEHELSNSKITEYVQEDLFECAKKGGFKGVEILKHFTVLDEEWTSDNGCLTSAQKIQRKKIADLFSDDINRMYGKTQ